MCTSRYGIAGESPETHRKSPGGSSLCERGRGLEGQAGGKPSVFPRQVCVLVIRLVELTWQSGVARAPELPALARSLPGA